MNWELTIAEFMKKLGFLQGKSNPCTYYHPARELRTEVRGDDFTTVGSFEDIKWFHTSAAKEWQVVERGVFGPPESPKDSQQIRVLNRIITWSNEGIWWEPDPRRAELIIKCVVRRWSIRQGQDTIGSSQVKRNYNTKKFR